MKLKQGNILRAGLNLITGTNARERRLYLVVSNNQYNQYFNTVLVVPISTADKYLTMKKYIRSPLFIEIKKKNIHGTALLQHIRTINPMKYSSEQPETTLSQQEISIISDRIQQFY